MRLILFILCFVSCFALAKGEVGNPSHVRSLKLHQLKVQRILRMAKTHKDPLVKELAELQDTMPDVADDDELDEIESSYRKKEAALKLKEQKRQEREVKLLEMAEKETGLTKEIVNQLLDVD